MAALSTAVLKSGLQPQTKPDLFATSTLGRGGRHKTNVTVRWSDEYRRGPFHRQRSCADVGEVFDERDLTKDNWLSCDRCGHLYIAPHCKAEINQPAPGNNGALEIAPLSASAVLGFINIPAYARRAQILLGALGLFWNQRNTVGQSTVTTRSVKKIADVLVGNGIAEIRTRGTEYDFTRKAMVFKL